LLTPRQQRYLFQQMNAKGWLQREPAELDVPIEAPRGLRKMAQLLFNLDSQAFARETLLPEGLAAKIVESSLALHENVVPLRRRKATSSA
jgi:hypothetical protein